MLPILQSPRDDAPIEAIRGKLSLRPLILEGLAAEESGTEGGSGASKFALVREILRDVRARGDAAVFDWTEKLDHVRLTPQTVRIAPEALGAALAAASPTFLRALDTAIANLRTYQKAMLPPEPAPILLDAAAGGWVGVKYTPLKRVGLYAPGGAAAYPSSVVHTAVPALVAGVKELVLVSPYRANEGGVNPGVLAAAARLGITEVYALGGAQAIAALAFGTGTIPAVDKIVGPGNAYVQLAKKELFGLVDIDSFAGPSEVIVLADDTAEPATIAAELLAQAEHAPGSALLITASAGLAQKVQAAVESQLPALGRQDLTRKALAFASALIVTPSHEAALALVDRFAPEHLQITTADALGDARKISNAGATFLGPYTPVAAGDYLAGPSHVLPTSGTARFFSGLSAESFRKRTSLIHFDRPTLDRLGQTIIDFATTEGLDAHAKSVTARVQH